MGAALLFVVYGLQLAPHKLVRVDRSRTQLTDEAPRVAPTYLRATGLNLTQESIKAAEQPQGVVLLRIQKTATTSFGDRILTRQCVARGLYCQVYWHLDWDLIASAPAYPKLAVATFLRHPVERVASEYEYVKTMGADEPVQWDYSPETRARLHREGLATLKDFVALPDNPAHNRMTRYVLGFARPALGCHQDCDANWDAFFRRGGTDPGAQLATALATFSEEKVLAVAKHRLAHSIQLLGVTDCFDSSVVLIGTQLGWDVGAMLEDAKVHYRVGGKNQTAMATEPHRPRLDATLVQSIEAQNRLDLELYLHARRLVNRRLQQLGARARCD